MVFLFFVTYHVFSKIRGNEKNIKMNNQAILLSVLGLFSYSVIFVDWATYLFFDDKYFNWYDNHDTKSSWIWWFGDVSFLLFHALFTLSYLRTTLKLTPLIEITKVYCEVLEKIPEREMKLEPLPPPKELEENLSKIQKSKRKLLR